MSNVRFEEWIRELCSFITCIDFLNVYMKVDGWRITDSIRL